MGVIGTAINQQETERQANKERDKLDKIIKRLKLPNFDYTKITPEEYRVLKDFAPEIAAYAEEKNPKLIELGAQSGIGRDAQMEALDRYRQLGRTGEDVQSRLLQDAALRDSAIQAQGQRASIQDQMARRGQGGGGLDLAAQLMAQQSADQRGALQSQQAAMNSYNARLDALKQGANLGGQIRGEDMNLASRNADITNAYNQRFAQNQNQYNQYASGLRNQAQLTNMQAAQNAADQNVGGRNQANQDYQNRFNQMQQQQFGNQAQIAGMRAGVQNQRIQDAMNRGKDREASMAGTRQMIGSAYGFGAAGQGQQKPAQQQNNSQDQAYNDDEYNNYA